MNRFSHLLAIGAMSALSSPTLAGLIDTRHGKEGDVNIGVSSAGQLVVEFNGEPVALPEIAGPLFGYGLDEPGFFTFEEDEPAEDIYVLGAGANIVLEVISFDAALKAREPGFGPLFNDPGETWDIGPAPFDEHPFWYIDSTDPGFVPPPAQMEWTATFRLLDTGTTGYASSEPVTVTFTPEPGTLVLLALGTLGLRRRSSAG